MGKVGNCQDCGLKYMSKQKNTTKVVFFCAIIIFMDWARRRKTLYLLLIFLFIIGVAFLLYLRYFDVPPTCFDKRKNGDETGVDCGGSCALYCPYTLSTPKVLWSRSFPISQTTAHAVAMIEHNNITAVASKINYKFSFYNEQNELVGEREGSTFLGPLGRTAISETFISISEINIARTTFTILEPISWHKISTEFTKNIINTERHYLENFSYTNSGQTHSRLSAIVKNDTDYTFNNVQAIAILYDSTGNAITTSKYDIPTLKAKETQNIFFTWPYPYAGSSVRSEIYIRTNLFDIAL